MGLGFDILRDVAPVMEVARVSSLTDPEVAEIYHSHEDWRQDDVATFVTELDSLHALREGLSVKCATDVALTVLGPGVYATLSMDRGWGDDAIRDWMIDALARLLLDDAPTAAGVGD